MSERHPTDKRTMLLSGARRPKIRRATHTHSRPMFAGWFPEYWEYTKAFYTLYDIPDWYDGLKRELTRYDDELAAERVLWNRFDQPGDHLRSFYERNRDG